MLDKEMNVIEECVNNGMFGRNLLQDLIRKATTPFMHTKEGYTTITKDDEATYASVLSMCAVDRVLSAKRQSDELSRLEAKRKQNAGKKLKRTPNTTRGGDGVSTAFRLQ